MNVIFRVDASIETGSGHIMRCLALADALKPVATINFVCRHLLPPLEKLILGKNFGLRLLPKSYDAHGDLAHSHWLHSSQAQDALDTIEAISATGKCDWLVIDHYSLDHRFENYLRKYVCKILVIDDLADRYHECDLLIDQNPFENQDTRYINKVSSECTCLLGANYCFIRDEFLLQRNSVSPRSGPVSSILIYFGGIDNLNKTQEAIETILDLAENDIASGRLKINVVIGSTHRACIKIKSICENNNINLHIQTQNMAKLMSEADLAIGAGGISTFERLYLRLPALVTPIAKNQLEPLRFMESLDYFSIYYTKKELRIQLAKKLRDGNKSPPDCVKNGIPKLLRLMHGNLTILQSISAFDIRRTFHWLQNDSLRQDFQMRAPPTRDLHLAYWRKVLTDSTQRIYAIYFMGQHVGNCGLKNINQTQSFCELWIYIGDAGSLGKGVANASIQAIKNIARNEEIAKSIYVHVSKKNLRAIRLYLATGFNKVYTQLSAPWQGRDDEIQKMVCSL